jgi:hypothetical protein
MKTPSGKYLVTFNGVEGDFYVGEERLNSIDYAGDDIADLVDEVISSDPNYPMGFQRLDQGDVVGVFHPVDNIEEVVAIMYIAR